MTEYEEKLVNLFCSLIDKDAASAKSGIRETSVDFGDGVEYPISYQVSFLAETEVAQARRAAKESPMSQELESVSRTGDPALISMVGTFEEIGKRTEGDYLLRFYESFYEKDEFLIGLLVLLEKAQVIIGFSLDDEKAESLKNNIQ